jgi:hypothetical protein
MYILGTLALDALGDKRALMALDKLSEFLSKTAISTSLFVLRHRPPVLMHVDECDGLQVPWTEIN